MLNHKLLVFFLISTIVFSCKKESGIKANMDIHKDSLRLENNKKVRSIGETLTPEAKKKIENWPEYQKIDELLTNFYSISSNEALNSSEELSQIAQQLKDSIKIDRFKQPDIGIRINVIYNSCLRLADMATIPTIKPNEVQFEVQKILDAYSALNSKINNITSQEKLEAEVKDIVIN